MPEWIKHRRKGVTELRDYRPGEDLAGISVGQEQTPSPGGKIARNPDDHADQWYVAGEYALKHYEPIE